MRKSEATKMPEDSPCHEVQGDVEREEFQLVPGLFQQKINQSSTDEMFKVRRTFCACKGVKLK